MNALAPSADEGRGKLRKASGRRKRSTIRRFPNGATWLEQSSRPLLREEPGEVKHLSNPRKRNRRDSLSSGERKGRSLNLAYGKTAVLVSEGLWDFQGTCPQASGGVTKGVSSRILLGKGAIAGESPLGERYFSPY